VLSGALRSGNESGADGVLGFRPEVLARGVVFDTQRDQRFTERVAPRIVAGAEAEHVHKQAQPKPFGFRIEDFDEAARGFAVLEGTVFGIFLFGVFGSSALDQAAEPELEQEGGEVKGILFPLEERGGIVEVAHEGQRVGRGEFVQLHRRSSSISCSNYKTSAEKLKT
jgi:hypothetical protein